MHAFHLDEVDGEFEQECQAREHEGADDGPHEAQLAVAVRFCCVWVHTYIIYMCGDVYMCVWMF